MLIKNAKVFIDGQFQDVEVQFDEKGITAIGNGLKDDEVIDAEGKYLYACIQILSFSINNFIILKTITDGSNALFIKLYFHILELSVNEYFSVFD